MIAYSAAASVVGSLIAATVDARTGYIPNGVTRTTSIVAFVLATAAGNASHACAGALVVGGALGFLYFVTHGRGLGLGDVKLGTAIGLGLGPLPGIMALGGAFVAGGAYASWLLATGRARRRDSVRFGPFLAAGALVGVALFKGSVA
jgi:prepilin signal peptidase PulO-like enzyme (type II secretory pathway)